MEDTIKRSYACYWEYPSILFRIQETTLRFFFFWKKKEKNNQYSSWHKFFQLIPQSPMVMTY